MCLLLITVISFPMTNVLGQEVGQQEQLLTYKDPTFGIEASYPSSWRKIDFNTSLLEPMNVIVGFTVGRDNQTGDEANVFIVVDDIDNRTTIKEYARDKYNEIKAGEGIETEILDDNATAVMGGDGWKIDYTYDLGKSRGTKWLRVMEDKGYEAQFGANKYLYDQFIDDAEGHLFSYQLVPHTSAPSTAAT
jgi:hypothetical protein